MEAIKKDREIYQASFSFQWGNFKGEFGMVSPYPRGERRCCMEMLETIGNNYKINFIQVMATSATIALNNATY